MAVLSSAIANHKFSDLDEITQQYKISPIHNLVGKYLLADLTFDDISIFEMTLQTSLTE